jgi:hypothetical protein
MTVTIGRRELLAALGSAAAAWPLAARAQQPAMPVIGFLHGASPEGVRAHGDPFRQGFFKSNEMAKRLSCIALHQHRARHQHRASASRGRQRRKGSRLYRGPIGCRRWQPNSFTDK